jgi:hypothetical protein
MDGSEHRLSLWNSAAFIEAQEDVCFIQAKYIVTSGSPVGFQSAHRLPDVLRSTWLEKYLHVRDIAAAHDENSVARWQWEPSA